MTRDQPSIHPRYGPDGLVPAVVQDAADGRVLMVAFMDAEALASTLEHGEVHFHSRSRGRLWRKGETSGNVLHLVRLDLDCDGDSLLVQVRPHGPTCHRGTRSCFDPAPEEQRAEADAPPADPPATPTQGFAWLEALWTTIEDRRRTRPPGSYTTSLLDGGVDAVGRKVTEEATELLMAAKDDATAEATGAARTRTIVALNGEAADLVYHALVLLAERGQSPATVIDVLKRRHGGPASPS